MMARIGAALAKSKYGVELPYASVLTAAFTILFVLLVLVSGGDARVIGILPGLALLAGGILNFELAALMLVSSIYVDLYFFNLSFAVWYAIPFGLAFLFKNRGMHRGDFSNPLTLSIAFYGACILPSLYNAANPRMSILMLINVAAFLIIIYSFVAGFKSFEDIEKVAVAYLVWVIADSVDVIVTALSGVNRPFGFAGIWFVDYSALGVCLATTIAFVSTGRKRVLAFSIALFIAVALVLTQTRSTWASAAITLFGLIGYLVWRPNVLGYTRRQVVRLVAIGTTLMVGVVILTLSTNPKIETRAVQLTKQSGFGFDREGNVENSLASRILIWDTAIEAFKAHPLIGIGVYQFRFSSQYYSELPQFLYDYFVSKLSVHQTHLAVLSETGILGFIGFLVFIIAIVRTTFQTLYHAGDEQTGRRALVASVCVVYCLVSMFITDAWLWGPQIVLLGIVVGSMLAVRKIGSSQDVIAA